MPIKVREIDPLVLRFYGDVPGCMAERRLDDIGLVQLRAGVSLIDLVPVASAQGRVGGAAPQAEGRNMDHFCLRVEPFDDAAIRRHLQAHGASAGATDERYGAQGNGPSIYLREPEGNTVELKGPPSAAKRALSMSAGSR